MNYGGMNDILQPSSTTSAVRFPHGGSPYKGNCPVCDGSFAKHRFSSIESDDYTTNKAKEFQRALDGVIVSGNLQGLQPARARPGMVGAARAYIDGAEFNCVTISGGDVGILKHVNGGGFGTLIDTAPDPHPININDKPVTLVPVDWGRSRDFPVGECAAQKLLMAVFKQAKSAKRGLQAITKINMAEIFWRPPANHTGSWPTGDLAESCDTCKQILPAMLCSIPA